MAVAQRQGLGIDDIRARGGRSGAGEEERDEHWPQGTHGPPIIGRPAAACSYRGVMFGPIVKGIGLAASPTGRKVIRNAVKLARSDEGKKLAAQARKVATSPEARKLAKQAADAAKTLRQRGR